MISDAAHAYFARVITDSTNQQKANRRKKFKLAALRKEKQECHALLKRAQHELEEWQLNAGEHLASRALCIEIDSRLRPPHVVHETNQLRIWSDGDTEFKTGPITVSK